MDPFGSYGGPCWCDRNHDGGFTYVDAVHHDRNSRCSNGGAYLRSRYVEPRDADRRSWRHYGRPDSGRAHLDRDHRLGFPGRCCGGAGQRDAYLDPVDSFGSSRCRFCFGDRRC